MCILSFDFVSGSDVDSHIFDRRAAFEENCSVHVFVSSCDLVWHLLKLARTVPRQVFGGTLSNLHLTRHTRGKQAVLGVCRLSA